MSVNSIIVKKHLRTNKKNLILNFFSLVFSLFALVFVVVVLMNSNNLEAQILNTYPNKNVYQVSKKINITDSNMSNGLIQLNRPTENELKNVKEFKDSFFDIDLFYLFDSYEVTKDNLKQNLAITFEPYFYNDEKILYSGFEIDDLKITINKDFLITVNEQNIYETFKFEITKYEFQKIKVFNFLSTPTVYYPYNLVKNAAKLTYFESIGQNLYDFLKAKPSNSIETNYSMLMVNDTLNLDNFNATKYADTYSLYNTSQEISMNFMNLFSSLLNFCFYFLIVIIVLVVILLLYSIHLIVLKNHKEIALMRTYGKSKNSINFLYMFEIFFLYLISYIFACGLTIGGCFLLNYLMENIFVIKTNFLPSVEVIFGLFFIIGIVISLLIQIPLFKVQKINIRKELNSI